MTRRSFSDWHKLLASVIYWTPRVLLALVVIGAAFGLWTWLT